MQITLVAFRGTGFRRPEYKSEPALIRAGHVGIFFEDEPETIYGFHPTAEAVEKAGGMDALLELLKQHKRQPGTVQDDTVVFQRAHILAEQGRRPVVYQITYDLPEAAYAAVREEVLALYQTQEALWYNFPYEDGTFEADECNCALFPARVGIPTPADNGMVSKYIEAMRQQGAVRWLPPQ